MGISDYDKLLVSIEMIEIETTVKRVPIAFEIEIEKEIGTETGGEIKIGIEMIEVEATGIEMIEGEIAANGIGHTTDTMTKDAIVMKSGEIVQWSRKIFLEE